MSLIKKNIMILVINSKNTGNLLIRKLLCLKMNLFSQPQNTDVLIIRDWWPSVAPNLADLGGALEGSRWKGTGGIEERD